MFLFKIKTYAFIGPSGTGKSYRAQYVASGKGIKYIIDDGLLIKDSQVIAGISAKKAPTKIETVKNALFLAEDIASNNTEPGSEPSFPDTISTPALFAHSISWSAAAAP